MQNLFAFFYRYAFVFLFLILEFVSIRLIIRRNESQREIFLNSSTIFSGKLLEKVNNVKNYFGLRKVNQDLAAENASLKAQVYNLTGTVNTRIDSVNDTVGQQRFLLIPAQIVNNSIEFRNNMMTINKGALDGIKKYSTVIESNGIVGFVKNVGKRYSSVISILNSNARVSVMIKRNHNIGNMVWDGHSPILVSIEAIPKHADIKVGDTIVTTEFSHFPRGHVVGEIISATIEPGGNFYEIEARLFNDIARTDKVYVVSDLHRSELDSLELLNSIK